MQRRAATVYGVLFLVIAAGAYSLIGVAQEPGIDLQGETYTENDTLTVGGLEYTVASISDGEGALERVNESGRYTATWANNSTTQLDDTTYRVLIPNETDPGQFTLREEFNLSENVSTVTQGGTEYVVVNRSDGNRSLVPVEEYKRQQFGEPETRQFNEGQTLQLAGNQTTVSNVTAERALLTWTAPQTVSTSFAQGDNVTLGPEDGGQQFVAHFPENDTLQLSPTPGEYQSQVGEIDTFNERMAGLWGIVILSIITVVMLVGLAFLPNK
ncbi:hypothetical protein [Halorussus salinus]|uniref:hypothetical protein n=1 Tax=Halorussus salinus TaxID=1364935 RepID=UPI00109294C1|nr:hypothetical protein [Halorussus salinus]